MLLTASFYSSKLVIRVWGGEGFNGCLKNVVPSTVVNL